MRKPILRATACAALVVLTACGGGGASPTVTTGAIPAPSTGGTHRLTGLVTFDSVPTRSAGGLDYGAVTAKPLRSVLVELLDSADKTLATGATDNTGRYSFPVPSNKVATLRVYSRMVRDTGDAGRWSVEVADNTDRNLLYAISIPIPATADGSADETRSVHIPSGWSAVDDERLTRPTGTRLAAPFAILDTIYDSQARVLAATPGVVFPPLSVFWSEKNRPSVDTDVENGAIGGTSFYPVGDGLMLVAGKADVDTDEYDSSVISHEWSHYWQYHFSRSDSMGGSHATGDLLDRNLAFGEGLANAWSGIATNSRWYIDNYGPRQGQALVQDLSAAPAGHRGWYNESSIQFVMWTLPRAVGLSPLLQALAGPFRSTVASTGIHAFNAALQSTAPQAAAHLAPLLLSQSIAPGADAWGIGETNDGGVPSSLPMAQSLQAGTPTGKVCVAGAPEASRRRNKLGDWSYLRYHQAAAGRVELTVTGPASSAPSFRVTGAKGPAADFSSAGSAHQAVNGSTTAGVELPAGDYLVSVVNQAASAAPTCFTVSIR